MFPFVYKWKHFVWLWFKNQGKYLKFILLPSGKTTRAMGGLQDYPLPADETITIRAGIQ
jgi:hypothetical protein